MVLIIIIVLIFALYFYFCNQKIKDTPELKEFSAPTECEAREYVKSMGYSYYSKKNDIYITAPNVCTEFAYGWTTKSI